MYPKIKRLMDIVISILALILFSPFAIIIMFVILFEDFGSPIYLQPRVGKGGELFNFFKFRSMVRNADEILFGDPELLKTLRTGSHKLKDDPRITRIGKIIRKYSIDEFPQFLNVLIGNMSVVGPRPIRPDELEKYKGKSDFAKRKIEKVLSVKPGITGLWQTGGRSEVSFDDRIDLELKYAESCSLFTDLYIMLKTPIAVLQAKGAV